MLMHWRNMNHMVRVGLHDFLFGGPTTPQPSTLQLINMISTLLGSICCLTAEKSVHVRSCPTAGQGDTHGDVRPCRHTPKHTLVCCNSSKTLQAENPPPPCLFYSASKDRGASKRQQMHLQAKRPCWHVFKHLRTFAALAVNILHHLFRKDKIREMTTVVVLRAGHDCAVLKQQQ